MTCCENTLFYVLLYWEINFIVENILFQRINFSICYCFIFHSLGSVKMKHEGKSVNNTGYFTSDNEPGGIENATHNTFPKLTPLF
jgi:hypothetical protein